MSPIQVDKYFIEGGGHRRPESRRTIYADGSANSTFRPGTDLELSHWVPTSTPTRWAADTSTEICLRFVEDPPDARYDLAINNHTDVDGVLCLFVLLNPEFALANRAVIVAAAEHGDLQAGVSREGVILAQELTASISRPLADRESSQDRYREGFSITRGLLDESRKPSAASQGASEILERGHRMLDDGTVTVNVVSERLVSFVLPMFSAEQATRALRIPPFNAVVDESVFLWPHARNRDHGEKVHLVSIPTADGWFHDLWLPGYVWALTPDRWAVPGIEPTGGSNEWTVSPNRLGPALEKLNDKESNPGSWAHATRLTPFSALTGRGFPVVASFTHDGDKPAASDLTPELVSATLAKVYEG